MSPWEIFGSSTRMRWLLLARSSFGFVGIAFAFNAIQLIPIGTATCLVMISPLISSLFAFVLLGEQINKWTVWALPISFLGVIFISEPGFLFGEDGLDGTGGSNVKGVLFAIIASLGAGLAYVCIRVLGTTMKCHYCVVTFAQALGQAVYGLTIVLFLGVPFSSSTKSILVCLSIGIIGSISQGLMTWGMQREKSAMASTMRMGDVLFSFLFQEVFTGDAINLGQVLGAVGICSGVLIVLYGKSREQSTESATEEQSEDNKGLVAEFELSSKQSKRGDVENEERV